MLYEAVCWCSIAHASNPPFEEGLSDPKVSKALTNWGERDGDIGVIALNNSKSVGAAWYRFFSSNNYFRGYLEETISVLVIAVHRDYRGKGIGEKLINWLIDHA